VLGWPVDDEELRPVTAAGGACVRFLVPAAGLLEDVTGVDDAASRTGVVWVRVYREPGAVLGPLRRGSDRTGAVLAVGATREEAVQRAGRAAETVRFVVANAPAEAAV
jgi:L-amino acid ligase C-terminal domain 2